MYKLKDILYGNIEDIKGPLIYSIINIKNNKRYIGSTKISIMNRFVYRGNNSSHKYRYENKDSSLLYTELNNNDLNDFYVEILEKDFNKTEIYNKEKYYISKYDTLNSGYNLTIGGMNFSKDAQINGAKKLSEICKEKSIGCFFNKEKHGEVARLGGFAAANPKSLLKRKYTKINHIIDKIIELNLEFNELGYNTAKKSYYGNKGGIPLFNEAIELMPDKFK